MSLFEPKATNWDKINGLRDLAGEKDTLQRYKTPWTVGGNIGNPSKEEPFIWTDLPPLENEWSGKEETDFLLRNGTLKDSATDITRISKLLTLTTRGKLFSVKQNLLSRSGVATEASGILNEGVYLPTSTLAQIGVVGLGGHLNKQGVNPFRKTGEVDNPEDDGNTILGFDVTNPLGLPAYAQVVRGDQKTGENRLVGYFNNKINRTQKPSSALGSFVNKLKGRFIKLDGPNILDSYSGGPGSVAGVGRTVIRMSPEQRTGKNNDKLAQSGFFTESGRPSKVNPNIKFKDFTTPPITDRGGSDAASLGGSTEGVETLSFFDYGVFDHQYNQKGYEGLEIKANQILNRNSSVSLTYQRLTGVDTKLDGIDEGGIRDLSQNKIVPKNTSVYQNGFETNEKVTNPEGSLSSTLTQKQLIERIPLQKPHSIGPDFRKSLTKQPNQTISNSLDYEKDGIITRVGVGDPGQRGDISDYQIGKLAPGDTNSTPLDKITSLPLYRSTTPTTSPDKNDLVKFRIASVDSSDPSNSVYIHFRAFLGSFSDSYNSTWGSQKFMGRAESFHNYEGFDRSISMNWTVPAQSKNELMIMHQKLNFLASNLAPDYVGGKYMAGPLVKLTVGGYLYEQYGFIESLTLNIPENSPWEIALAGANKKNNSSEEIEGGEGRRHDTSVKELPHIIEASLSFKPIHNFVVRKQHNGYNGKSLGKTGQILSKYGLQQYIALKTSTLDASGYNVEKTKPKNTGQKIK
mgnify:CR=1 FL=1